MKNIVLISVAILLGFTACQNAPKNQNQHESKPEITTTTEPAVTANAAPTAIFDCPMHPEISGKAGDKCSKCKMNLEEKKAPTAIFDCPMHPEISGKAGDKCPKCKMNLEEKKAPTAIFACPMHPEITGKAGDKCPKCKMDLEEKK